jgi:cob(I)alamin adenosyltransferase
MATTPTKRTAAKTTTKAAPKSASTAGIKFPKMPKMPTAPAIDLSGLDATKLADLDEKVVAAARDAAYITIGFGVLAAQKAQVRRRELGKQMSEKMHSVKFEVPTPNVDDVKHTVESQITKLEARLDALEATLDKAVDSFEQRLPDQAATLVGQAHDMAKTARKQVRGLVRSAI